MSGCVLIGLGWIALTIICGVIFAHICAIAPLLEDDQ